MLTPPDPCHCEASAHNGCGNPFSFVSDICIREIKALTPTYLCHCEERSDVAISRPPAG